MQVQWFPGHMAKTKKMIQEHIKLVDVVIELVDARLPESSRNPLLNSLLGDKPRIVILNKEDLADPQRTAYWLKNYTNENQRAIAFNATVGKKGLLNQLREMMLELTEAKRARMAAKGVKRQTIRCMIVGIPNVGKSTFINVLVGKKSAKTGNKPGVTRGTQWIKLGQDVELLDTPGILWPKFDDEEVGFRLAISGAVSDEVFDWEEGAYKLLQFLRKHYAKLLKERYKLNDGDFDLADYELLEQMGRNRGCLLKGNTVDMNKIAKMMITEFRQGKIGRITLE